MTLHEDCRGFVSLVAQLSPYDSDGDQLKEFDGNLDQECRVHSVSDPEIDVLQESHYKLEDNHNDSHCKDKFDDVKLTPMDQASKTMSTLSLPDISFFNSPDDINEKPQTSKMVDESCSSTSILSYSRTNSCFFNRASDVLFRTSNVAANPHSMHKNNHTTHTNTCTANTISHTSHMHIISHVASTPAKPHITLPEPHTTHTTTDKCITDTSHTLTDEQTTNIHTNNHTSTHLPVSTILSSNNTQFAWDIYATSANLWNLRCHKQQLPKLRHERRGHKNTSMPFLFLKLKCCYLNELVSENFIALKLRDIVCF